MDRTIVSEVRNFLATYKRPVLIGESGLNAAAPDSADGKITVADNARLGVQHAIWAAVVSGAMNGRALYWEDSFGIYFSNLGIPWMQKYETEELPAANFVNGVDFSGFQPLASTITSGVWGAAVGNEKMVLGWYRDAGSEPPDWTLQPVVSKQTVTITVPGKGTNWKVDFYNTRDGTTILSSVTVSRTGSTITIPLPDFQDDIAFKMAAGMGTGIIPTLASAIGGETVPVSTPSSTTMTDPIAGTWNGTISNLAGTFSTAVKLSIPAGCRPGQVCGTFSAPQLPCTGDLFLQTINGGAFLFQEQNVSGAASCLSGGFEQLQLLADGTIAYGYLTTPGSDATSTGILKHP